MPVPKDIQEQDSPLVGAQEAGTWSRYQPLACILIAACVGVAADRFLPLPVGVWWLAAAGAVLSWWTAWRFHHPRVACCLLLAAIASAGGAWHHLRWHLFDEDDLGRFAQIEPVPVCVRGVALAAPRFKPAPPRSPLATYEKGEQSWLPVQVTHLHRAKWQKASGTVLLYVDGHLLGVVAGDHLEVRGKLHAARKPLNPGEFDFAQHLRKDRRLCWLAAGYPESVSIVARGRWFDPRRILDQIRRRGDDLIWKYVAPERAPLAAAILLGERSGLDQQRKDDFFLTGVVHLLCISGLHVGILAGALWWVAGLGFLSRRQALLAVAGAVVLYAILTDARPPVVRAAILTVTACAGSWMGRRALSLNSLAAAGLVVLAMNPADLFQVGVQLSFLAVATLGVAGRFLMPRPPRDPLDRLIARSRPWPSRFVKTVWSYTWRSWLAGAIVWLTAFPLALRQFHLAAPVGILLNPVLWIPVCISLLAGLCVLSLGWLAPPLGHACGWLCDVSLAFVESCVQWASHIPGGRRWISGPPIWWIVTFYLGLAVGTVLPRRRIPLRWRWTILLSWTALGLFISGNHSRNRASAPVRCTFLSVGHGTSAVVELPGGQTLLYDAGRLGAPAPASRVIAGFLWSRGITHLDAVVLSHADADHYNALPELLQYVSVGVVYVSPSMFQFENDALRVLKRSIDEAGVPLREVYCPHRLETWSTVQIELLHPPRVGVSTIRETQRDNANSIVLNIEHHGRRLLLPGDLEGPGLTELMADGPLDVDVLMAPHHGSYNSDPPAVAQWCSPEWVVISSGSDDDARTAAAYAAIGAQVLHTARDGAIEVVFPTQSSGDFQVTPFVPRKQSAN